jgi:hypothetical protein
VLVLELLAPMLDVPGAIASLQGLLDLSLARSCLPSTRTSRQYTTELDITLSLRVRRTSRRRHLSACDRHLG